MENKIKVPFWKSTWFAIVMIVVFPIAGIIFTWGTGMKKNAKIITTVIACFYMFLIYPSFFRPAAAPGDDPPLQQISDSIESNEDLKTSMEGVKDSWSSFTEALF